MSYKHDIAANVQPGESVLLGENKIGNNRWFRKIGSTLTGGVIMENEQGKHIEVAGSLSVIRKTARQ